MSKPRDERQKDLLRPALEQIIDMGHPLVRLAGEIDWGFLERRFASVCTTGPGQPPLPARLIAGLFILKHMHSLSDEVLCAMGGEPVLPILLRRAGVPPRSALRSLIHDPVAPAAGRGASGGAAAGACRSPTRREPWRPRTWSGWWWTPPCSPRRSPIRPMPG
jgi:hypothetical protein